MKIFERHDFLGEYIKNATSAAFGIAAFQRPFVWKQDDVERFMRSIQKGLPVGSFLLWTPDPEDGSFPPSKGRIGPVEHGVETKTLILDGQNRLSSLVWAARRSEAPFDPAYSYSTDEIDVFMTGQTLVADAEEQRIHFVPDEAAWGRSRMPLGVILGFSVMARQSSRLLFKQIDDHGVAEENIKWLLDIVPSWFQTKKVVVTELFHASPEEAIEAFLAVARAGQPITKEDYDRAVQWIGQHDPGRSLSR
jgi:hypothetical protein